MKCICQLIESECFYIEDGWGRSFFSQIVSRFRAFAPFIFFPFWKSTFVKNIHVFSPSSYLECGFEVLADSSVDRWFCFSVLNVLYCLYVFHAAYLLISYSADKHSSSWQNVWEWALRCITRDSENPAMISKGNNPYHQGWRVTWS
jgi:hypothetical protein